MATDIPGCSQPTDTDRTDSKVPRVTTDTHTHTHTHTHTRRSAYINGFLGRRQYGGTYAVLTAGVETRTRARLSVSPNLRTWYITLPPSSTSHPSQVCYFDSYKGRYFTSSGAIGEAKVPDCVTTYNTKPNKLKALTVHNGTISIHQTCFGTASYLKHVKIWHSHICNTVIFAAMFMWCQTQWHAVTCCMQFAAAFSISISVPVLPNVAAHFL